MERIIDGCFENYLKFTMNDPCLAKARATDSSAFLSLFFALWPHTTTACGVCGVCLLSVPCVALEHRRPTVSTGWSSRTRCRC